MKETDNKLEQYGIGLILAIALLMFLSPLVRMRGPGGDLLGDGYHLRSGMTQLRSMLAVVSTVKESGTTEVPSRSQDWTPRTPQTPVIPFSLNIASLAPWLIYIAMAFACLALLDHASFKRATAKLSLVGGCFAALAVLHLIMMGLDLQSWAMDLLTSGLLNSGDNGVLLTRLLVVNSFQVSPGIGLVGLTACLWLVPFLAFTRAVARVRSVVRSEPRIRVTQPVHVRPLNPDCPAETCTSLDLSRSGLFLESGFDHYYVGMELLVKRNLHSDSPAGAEEHGSVVRVQKLEGGRCRFAIHIFSTTDREIPADRSSKWRKEDQVIEEIGAGIR